MLSFVGSWHAQPCRLGCWLSFAAKTGFAFDVNEPGSRRGAERQTDQGRRMSERSEFGAPRLTRAPQGIRPFGPDGGRGDSVFAYFLRSKSKAHQLGKAKRRNAFDFEFPKTRPHQPAKLAALNSSIPD